MIYNLELSWEQNTIRLPQTSSCIRWLNGK